MKLEVFTVGMFQENTYVLWDDDSKKALLIDPGGENERIIRFLDQNGLTPLEIINTHGHIDHIAGAKELQEHFGIPFRIHRDDVLLIDHAETAAGYFGVGYNGKPNVDGVFDDGDVIKLGENEIRVIHTPGHSPGGVCFHIGSDVIVGDTLFAMSIGRTDLPGGSFNALISSIKNRLFPLGDDVRVFPGHGPATTIGAERKHNPFLAG